MAGALGTTPDGGHVMKSPTKPSGKKGGRPVTWVGGGGLSYQSVAQKSVPELRAIFFQVFGHPTASNNSSWLRRKLSDPPDDKLGRGRGAQLIRKRDQKTVLSAGPKVATSAEEEDFSCVSVSADNESFAAPRRAPKSPARKRKQSEGITNSSSVADSTTSMDSAVARSLRRKISETGSVDSMEATYRQDHAMVAIIATLKHLSGPGFGPQGPNTVEVFWPDSPTGGGGNWWPAKVVKVHPRKGKCRILYDTLESEELDLVSILVAKHLRLVECPFSEAEMSHPDLPSAHGFKAGEDHGARVLRVPQSEHKVALETSLHLVCGEEENDAEQQALNELQGIMQDPIDCVSLPCLSPESSVEEPSESSKEWLSEVDFLMPFPEAPEGEERMRSELQRLEALEANNDCPSEGASMEAFLFDHHDGSVAAAVFDETFSSPGSSVQSSTGHSDPGSGFHMLSVLPSGALGSGPPSALPGADARQQRAQVAPAATFSRVLDEQVEALKQRIHEKMQQIQHIQMSQQPLEAGFQANRTALLPGACAQTGVLFCTPPPTGWSSILQASHQDDLPPVCLMASSGSHCPMIHTPACFLTAPYMADFGSFMAPSPGTPCSLLM